MVNIRARSRNREIDAKKRKKPLRLSIGVAGWHALLQGGHYGRLPCPASASRRTCSAISPVRRRTRSGDTVRAVLENVFGGNPRLRSYLLDDQGSLRRHVNIFINDAAVSDRDGVDRSGVGARRDLRHAGPVRRLASGRTFYSAAVRAAAPRATAPRYREAGAQAPHPRPWSFRARGRSTAARDRPGSARRG